MNRSIKLGIIGCGIAARDLHWPALKKLTDKFEITAVCNHTEPKAKQFAEMVGGVPYVLDYRELLKRTDIEAVDIILPIELNCQVTKDCLSAGKHVIVEKPLAVNLDQAKKMLKFEKEFSKVMMVAENFRYRQTFFKLKEILEQDKIGTPYSVFWNVFYLVESSNKYAQTNWRIHHQYPGGFITDGGVHNIAALRYLFGDLTSGIAFTKSINPAIGKLDTFSFQFRTTEKVDGVLNLFFSANGYNENRIIILGDKGSIIIEGNSITIMQNGKQNIREDIKDDSGYIGEFEDFYKSIRVNKKVISTFIEAYRDLKTIIGALQSAETGERIVFKF